MLFLICITVTGRASGTDEKQRSDSKCRKAQLLITKRPTGKKQKTKQKGTPRERVLGSIDQSVQQYTTQ